MNVTRAIRFPNLQIDVVQRLCFQICITVPGGGEQYSSEYYHVKVVAAKYLNIELPHYSFHMY